MERRIDLIQLFSREVLRIFKRLLGERAQQREGSVEHQSRFRWLVHILIGVAQCDGAHCRGESATHTPDAEGHKDT